MDRELQQLFLSQIIPLVRTTLKETAATPLKTTCVVVERFSPAIVTCVPTGPLGGENELITGCVGPAMVKVLCR